MLPIAFVRLPDDKGVVDDQDAIDPAVEEGRSLINRILLENLAISR